MNTKWKCRACKKVETTGPNVKELAHVHGRLIIALEPFRKQRRTAGEVTVKSMKLDAWDVFSEYIRRSYADDNGYAECVTCGTRKPWREMQAGHFISRRYTMILFDERNVHPQCPYCNGPLSGNISAYQNFMVCKYGQSIVDHLFKLAKLQHKFSIKELNDLIIKYKEKLQGLAER
jgi:hypothetical protein